LATGGFYLCHHLGRRLGVLGIVHGHSPTLAGGQDSGGRANAAAAAGDQQNGFQGLTQGVSQAQRWAALK
jgi:hypothetical protein